MLDIRTRVRWRADIENSDHISDSELNALISEKYGEQCGIVCDAGSRYLETTESITATGAASYAEPTDVRDDLALDYLYSDGRRRRLTLLRPTESNAYAGLTGDAFAFTHVNDRIYLYPRPSSGSYEFVYIPQSPDLSSYADADLVDLMCEAGEAFLIWGTAAMAKAKSESSVQNELDEEAKARARLMYWAAQNAIADGRRPTAQDIEGSDVFDPADWRYRS